jgi:thiamine biosynthesis lipoprotein
VPSSSGAAKRVRPACGTWLEITLPFEDAAAHAAAFAEAARLERIFSAHDPASEVSALNRRLARAMATETPRPFSEFASELDCELSSELAAVLELGERIESRSAGAFRLRDPQGRLDLGGIAKGAVVDGVFDLLSARIPRGPLLVNAGGDLRVRGAHDIEIRVPATDGTELRYGYRVQDAALATSSRLEGRVGRPSAKYPPEGTVVNTACVLAATAAQADALTKAVIFGAATWSGISNTPAIAEHALAVLAFDERGRALPG